MRTSSQPTPGTGIEIDPQFIRMIEIARPHRMRMQLDAAQIDDPGQPGRIVDDNFFRSAAGRKRKRDGAQPIGTMLRERASDKTPRSSAPFTKRFRTIGRSRIPASAPGATDR